MKNKIKLFILLLFCCGAILQAQNISLNLTDVTVREAIEAVKCTN